MPSSSIITMRVEAELRRRLERLAKAQRRSKSFVAAEALRDYVDVHEWQVEETRKALAEAERGDFASDGQVRRVIDKYTRGRARRGR
jgi:predicted transcriptional regulator